MGRVCILIDMNTSRISCWETGLSLLGFRYYDAGAGRFLNRDPIGYGGGVNLYNYTGNNPANANDPSGLYHIQIWVPYQGGAGICQVVSDPGDMVPIFPHTPGTPWWPSVPGMGPFGGSMPDPVGGNVIVGPFPISSRFQKGHTPFPPGEWPIIGFRPGNKFKHHRDAYGPGGVIVGGVPSHLGTWIHGFGLWDPTTGMINEGRRTWCSPTNGCLRGDNGDIEQIGDIINLNPGRGWVDYVEGPIFW